MHKSIWYSLNFAHVNQLDRYKSNDRPFPIAKITINSTFKEDTPINTLLRFVINLSQLL